MDKWIIKLASNWERRSERNYMRRVFTTLAQRLSALHGEKKWEKWLNWATVHRNGYSLLEATWN